MRKKLTAIFQPWFVITLCIAALHQLLQKVGQFSVPLLDHYLDPLLLMPILLHLILWEKRIVFRKGNSYVLPLNYMAIILVVVSFVVEYLFPKWSTDFTADYYDILCYIIGTLTYAFFFNTPLFVKKHNK